MDDVTESVQPEGQGGESGDSPYADYLNRIPEEVRGDVEPVFRDWDAQTTRKFQEASEYRKGWEPFEQLGVNQRDPAEVEWALQFLDAQATNPQAVQEWFQAYAQERGLTPAEAAAQQDEFGGSNEYVDPSVSQLLEQQLSAQLGPISQQLQEMSEWRQSQEQQAQQAHIRSEIQSEMESLKAAHPDEFSEPMVEKFIANHMNEADARTAVRNAFSDWQSVRNQIEKDALQGKVDVPPGAESGGSAAAASEPAQTLAQAKAQALEMLRANRS